MLVDFSENSVIHCYHDAIENRPSSSWIQYHLSAHSKYFANHLH